MVEQWDSSKPWLQVLILSGLQKIFLKKLVISFEVSAFFIIFTL